MICSEHEWNVECLDAIANVNASIVLTVDFVICVSAWPELAAKNGCLAKSVLHDSPATLGQVLAGIVKESMVINTLLTLIQLNVLLQQWLTEVDIVADIESLLSFQTFECLILAHFVERSFLDGSHRDNRAVTVNLMHDVRETVKLGDALGWDLYLRSQEIVNVHE